jgi:hypothetical protein
MLSERRVPLYKLAILIIATRPTCVKNKPLICALNQVVQTIFVANKTLRLLFQTVYAHNTMQIHVCLLIVTQVIIVRKTIPVVWLVFTAHIKTNKVRRHALTPLSDIMSQEQRKLHKRHVRPVHPKRPLDKRLVTTVLPADTKRTLDKRHVTTVLPVDIKRPLAKRHVTTVLPVDIKRPLVKRHVTTVLPVDIKHNKAKRIVSTLLLGIMPQEQCKLHKRHVRPVHPKRPLAKRHVTTVPPADIKNKPVRIHVTSVSTDTVQQARLNRCNVLSVIILLRAVQIVSNVPPVNSNRRQTKRHVFNVQRTRKRGWELSANIKTKQVKRNVNYVMVQFQCRIEMHAPPNVHLNKNRTFAQICTKK